MKYAKTIIAAVVASLFGILSGEALLWSATNIMFYIFKIKDDVLGLLAFAFLQLVFRPLGASVAAVFVFFLWFFYTQDRLKVNKLTMIKISVLTFFISGITILGSIILACLLTGTSVGDLKIIYQDMGRDFLIILGTQ